MRRTRRTATRRRKTKSSVTPKASELPSKGRARKVLAAKRPHRGVHPPSLSPPEWEATFNAVPDSVSIHDLDFRIIKVNKAFAKLLKAPVATLLGTKCYEVIHGSTEPWEHCPHVAALKRRKPVVEEFFEPKLKLYVQVTCSPIFDRKGAMLGTIHVVRDITEARRMGELIKSGQAQQLLVRDTVIDTIQIGVAIIDATDPNRKVVYINKAFEKITGYGRAEVVGQPLGFLRGLDSSPSAMKELDAAFAAKRPVQTELLLYTKDGSPFWCMVRVTLVRDTQGNVTHFVSTLSDVTVQREAEAASDFQREELLHLTRVAQLGELASSIAHEINQPLTAILSNAQAAQRFLAQEKPDFGEIAEILKDIAEDDKRAGEVLRRLRTSLKKKDFEFEQLDINELIGETVDLLRTHTIVRNKAIKLDLDSHVASVRGDRIQLQQVLLNLITNGLDSMSESGPDARELQIRTARKGSGWVVVSVKDSGLGIPENKMRLLFRHFFTTKPEGMGMGLPISRSIIEAHGGQLSAENNPDRGATFSFTLPVYAKT